MELKEYNNTQLNFTINAYIEKSGNPWFKGKEIATLLGYEDADDAIRKHVDEDDKKTLPGKTPGQVNWCTFLNGSGLYSLILRSKLDSVKNFQRWVRKDVLPSIRKNGFYSSSANPYNNVFKIEDEYDLHTKVTHYIRRFYPNALIAGLGELQDTVSKRIKSYKKGCQKGQPDIIITNLHKYYNRFCIEFKTSQINGKLTDSQKKLPEKYEKNNYKCLVSVDYDFIITEIIRYMCDTRIKCPYCRNKKFRNNHTLDNHKINFHRIKI